MFPFEIRDLIWHFALEEFQEVEIKVHLEGGREGGCSSPSTTVHGQLRQRSGAEPTGILALLLSCRNV